MIEQVRPKGTILIDMADGNGLSNVSIESFHDRVSKFIKEHRADPATVLAWRDQQRIAFQTFFAHDKNAALDLKQQFEALEAAMQGRQHATKPVRFRPASRESVLTPPPGWRKPIPLAVKLQVIVNQRGLAPTGEPLDAIGAGIEFDHRPCLSEREYDAEQDETIPAANDPAFIVALPAALHHSLSGHDNVRIRKIARLRKKEVEFRDTLVRKEPGQRRETEEFIRGRRTKRIC